MGGLNSAGHRTDRTNDFYPRSTITARKAVPAHFRFHPRLMVITGADIEGLIERLRGRGWVTGAALGVKSGWEKRRLKGIVEAAQGVILHFRGSPGFKLASEATKAELRRGVAALRCEARRPLKLALGYQRLLRARTLPPNYTLEFRFQEDSKTNPGGLRPPRERAKQTL